MQQFSLIGQQQPPYGLRHAFGHLSVLEFCHEQEYCAALYHGEDAVLVLVHDEVHLPVSEAFAVGLWRALVYAHAVLDVGGLRLVLVRGAPVVLHLVPAVLGQLARLICPYELVDGLMGDLHALLLQIAGDLGWRPLLVHDELLDTPDELRGLPAVAWLTVAALHGLLMRLLEVITAVTSTVAFKLTADGRFTYSNRFGDGLLCTTLLSFQINVVPLLRG